jgi:LysM repeat protein
MAPLPTSSARLLAPLALVLCAIAVLIVIGGSLGDGDGESSGGASATEATGDGATRTDAAPEPRARASYTVEPGDTLGAIAEETGVSVETLQELNPELDPQALIAGQKIKLRE